MSGTLEDSYSGRVESFALSAGDSSQVDIDHVVALGDAWQKGAQQLDFDTRVRLANDPLNLLAVGSTWNRQKGDGDAATWLPPNKRFRCTYVAIQIAVKQVYRLWVTAAEQTAMSRVLSICPEQPLPTGIGVPVPSGTQGSPDPPQPTSTATAPYASCEEARAAGDAPMYRGEPGYSPDLDGDGDGIACE